MIRMLAMPGPVKLAVAVTTLLVGACVTVNVYFPEAAAEKAADRIIREVYGGDAPASEQGEPPGGDDQSSTLRDGAAAMLAAALGRIVPAAHAQEPDIDLSTPAINQLKASMRQRHSQLRQFYDSGALGMTNNGLLTIRAPQQIPIRERNQAKQLVVAENRDRNTLYSEIAEANGHPEWEARIRDIFARRWVANAPSGWWFQDSSGDWRQK